MTEAEVLLKFCPCTADCDSGFIVVPLIRGGKGIEDCRQCIGADKLELGESYQRLRGVWQCEDCGEQEDMEILQPHINLLHETGSTYCESCATIRED